MAQWLFVEWLLIWVLETTLFEFDWDHGNRTKSTTKHDVSIDEVESLFRLKRAVPLGVQIKPPVQEQRLGVIGITNSGRVLQVAFVFREGRVRVISARPAHRKERAQYEALAREIFQGL